MTVAVVDGLEVVDVHHKVDWERISPDLIYLSAEQLLEVPVGGQPGEVIVIA
ncbi:MAG: hypothetical protein M3022_16580 [Actinomycetota bacterium]|nr:hypothetical protein [Actinomycetota bacterium]